MRIRKAFNLNKIFFVFVISLLATSAGWSNGSLPHDDHAFVVAVQDTKTAAPKVINRYRRLLQGLHYVRIQRVTSAEFERDQQRTVVKPLPEFRAPPNPAPSMVPIEKIHYMQASMWTLMGGKKYDMLTAARRLKTGALRVTDLPRISVWQDQQHRIWSLDHRRLGAFTLSSVISRVPVLWATKAQVEQDRSRFTTVNGGTQAFVYLTERLVLILPSLKQLAEKAEKAISAADSVAATASP